MIFIYPRELRSGDRLRISDDVQVWWEEVDSITLPAKKGGNILVFTKARMIVCDPGDKVVVERREGESNAQDPSASEAERGPDD
ncbi:hypothetical protein SEA_WOLLYPOG_41 [Arthrobacter phage Wollypog]|uniref:Uncharacterized protein n=1 Tax=Arthrobacter phage Wollypog TaxID=2790985 RepID=A0A7T3N3E5_9CAUD|nr:hypothetical protein PP291_gp41 [Arthrobacter phage Wollypog]QPX62593.1 hypothetical protein SEA_WOLLYPOG_41 [Arthrobacter phage Wollypog]